LAQCQFKVTG